MPRWSTVLAGSCGSPGYILEIEELSHVDLCGIPLCQRLQVESRLNELQHRGIVSDGVRDVIFLVNGDTTINGKR